MHLVSSETEQIQNIATKALLASHTRHNLLGRAGLEPVVKNQFGEGMYGTLLGMYAGIKPKYGDQIFSGMMIHATGELFSCLRGQGSFATNVNSGDRRQLHTSTTTTLDRGTPMRVDAHWPESRAAYERVYEAFNTPQTDLSPKVFEKF